MNLSSVCAGLMLMASAALPLAAKSTPVETARTKDVPTKVESYYRVKWGSLKNFVALYDKNHKRLLEELRKAGFILDMKTEFPFTHLAAGPRWDMRVTITYRDAAAALNDPAWDKIWDEAKRRLFQDLQKLEEEEAARFALLEDHWDVVISDVPQ